MLFFSARLVGQVNLVPNPSFEQFDTCPNNLDQLSYASYWYNPNNSSPDYFNSCGGNVPQNAPGWQMPRTGNAYGGFSAYNYYYNGSGLNIREYVGVPLIDTLQRGKHYCVEFYVSLSDSSYWAINRLGLYLSNNPATNVIGETLSYIPQIAFDTNELLTDKIGWMRISGTYLAAGGERYVTIGNFYADNQTDTIGQLGVAIAAYYYIDDVAVYEITDCDAGNNASICYQDSVQLGVVSSPGVVYSWSPLVGLNNSNISNPKASPDTTITYVLSQLECDWISYDTVTITVNQDCHTAPAIVIPSIIYGDQEFFITGLEQNSKLELYDVRGRLLYSFEDYENNFWTWHLAQGIYVAHLLRPNGEWVAQKFCVVR